MRALSAVRTAPVRAAVRLQTMRSDDAGMTTAEYAVGTVPACEVGKTAAASHWRTARSAMSGWKSGWSRSAAGPGPVVNDPKTTPDGGDAGRWNVGCPCRHRDAGPGAPSGRLRGLPPGDVRLRRTSPERPPTRSATAQSSAVVAAACRTVPLTGPPKWLASRRPPPRCRRMGWRR